MSTATATVKKPGSGGGEYQVRGTAAAIADAIGELQAKLAGSAGTTIKVSTSETQDVADYPAAGNVMFDDYQITIQRGSGATAVRKSLPLNNWTKAIELANSNGQVDIANGLVTAYVGAYTDSDGNSDYVILSGHSV
jgi:hypothetical protein